MSNLQAIILGIVQGLTEFFPVSSSGHLKLFQVFFGWSNLGDFILFDLICHLGTLLAILIFLRRELFTLFTKERSSFFSFAIALAPLVPILFLLKQLHHIYNTPQLLGAFFLVTACLLYLGERVHLRFSSKRNFLIDPLIIGCFQAMAILPGVSRSGATIAGARIMGWSYEQAFRFSFLLAIPTIIGGSLLEGKALLEGQANLPPVSLGQYALGFLFSFVAGYFALKALLKLLARGKMKVFIVYCAILGIFTLWYTNF